MEQNQKPSFFQVIGSVVAAAIGVQSTRNRERDFSAGGSATPYIIAGVAFTILLILTIIGAVRLVLG